MHSIQYRLQQSMGLLLSIHSFSWLISTISWSNIGYIIPVSTGNTQIDLVHGGCTSELISSRHILSLILLANTIVHTGYGLVQVWWMLTLVVQNLYQYAFYINWQTYCTTTKGWTSMYSTTYTLGILICLLTLQINHTCSNIYNGILNTMLWTIW